MTIFALSTGSGLSGIAIIRVSGANTQKVIKKLIKQDKLPSPRLATLKKIYKINSYELIDEGLIIWFPGPNSYTGEDMAEIHIHGSRAAIKAINEEISKIHDCRMAEPGEFTKKAFQNGKINLLKAESISDLICSETEIQRKQAIKIMSGKSSKKFNFLREKLLKILSNIEAKIDFPEDDLPENVIKNIKIDSKIIRKRNSKNIK
jgi:Predicted GTPase